MEKFDLIAPPPIIVSGKVMIRQEFLENHQAIGDEMEHWIEINLFADSGVQNEILLDVMQPYVERLKRKGTLVSWHYFREPEIRFRLRLKSKRAKAEEIRVITSLADTLRKQKLISRWHFGKHGEEGRFYMGEGDRYGRKGWNVAQDYFNNGAEIALRLLALKKGEHLENPLWAKGLGNPWEGGGSNPWKEREEDPLLYHWSRYVHLFTNQLGFDIDNEARLCSKQASRYRKISTQFGIKW